MVLMVNIDVFTCFIYFSILAHAFDTIIDITIWESVHEKYVVGGLNNIEKMCPYNLMATNKLSGTEGFTSNTVISCITE